MATAMSMVGTGTPRVKASWLVHIPVPFCRATSRITSTIRLPVRSSSLVKISAVISTRKPARSPVFQAPKISASRSLPIPAPRCIRS